MMLNVRTPAIATTTIITQTTHRCGHHVTTLVNAVAQMELLNILLTKPACQVSG